ncbi:MAG: 4-hydroxy-3-methylbut-2-enyl diphosphate reductase [Hyphomicrobiaceae bacterium]
MKRSKHQTDTSVAQKSPLRVLLAAPRGFCAGVDRAIQIVELALKKYGPPVYVRHEIVHNRYVVDGLKAKGAIFVEELDEIPITDAPVIFSAHGVPKSVPQTAKIRNLFYLDATCPLVTKVHREAEMHHRAGRQIALIGHAGHPEVVGTMGQLPDGAITLIETIEDAEVFAPDDPDNVAYATQTTLSLTDTAAIVEVLERRFPKIAGPHMQDICYATTNRQRAVSEIADRCDLILVVGAPNSSNSKRLVEVAERAGCPQAFLVQRATQVPWDALSGASCVGISAGASAPETLVQEIIDALGTRFDLNIAEVEIAEENIAFNIPRVLRNARAT